MSGFGSQERIDILKTSILLFGIHLDLDLNRYWLTLTNVGISKSSIFTFQHFFFTIKKKNGILNI